MIHKVVDRVASGLVDGAKGAIRGAAGGAKGIGNAAATALDIPFQAILGREGPHHIVSDVLDGGVNSVETFVNEGILDGVKKVGAGVSNGLDRPLRQVRL